MKADRYQPIRHALPGRASGSQMLLRGAAVAGGVVAVGCTRAASGDSIAAIDLGLILLAVLCAATPDTHVGLVMVGAVGVNWVVTVDDPATPWAMGVAVALVLFHAATAAATVSPFAASWTRAMARRWIRRFAVVAAVSVPVWASTAALDQADIPAASTLATAALLVLAASGLWLRTGGLIEPTPDGPPGDA